MSQITEPKNARSRRTRAALLRAARELIENTGFEAVTMAAVAERAGVSHRALYLHFGSRSQLLTALYQDLADTEELAASLKRVWAAPDAVSALTEWAEHIARSHPRILAVNRAIERARSTDADAEELWSLTMRNWLSSCRRLSRWLEEDARLSPAWTVDTAADMLWCLMSWDVTERLVVSRSWSRARFGRQLAAMLTATFVAPVAEETNRRSE
jgi:AcrR family transcriptional regulator